MLSSIFGIESIIKKEPDVVLTVRDGAKAQVALHGAPGSVRLIDEKTVYVRMPPTFLEPETCLMVLKNLMRGAYDRQINGIPAPSTKPPDPRKAVVAVETIPAKAKPTEIDGDVRLRPTVRLRETKSAIPAKNQKPKESADYIKLVMLRDQGILTEQEFQAALSRLITAGIK